MSNKNLSFSTNSGKRSTFMNSHQKLPRRPGARWLNLKPVSKSSIISYRNSAVKQKKQTNRKHKVQQSRVNEQQCTL